MHASNMLTHLTARAAGRRGVDIQAVMPEPLATRALQGVGHVVHRCSAPAGHFIRIFAEACLAFEVLCHPHAHIHSLGNVRVGELQLLEPQGINLLRGVGE